MSIFAARARRFCAKNFHLKCFVGCENNGTPLRRCSHGVGCMIQLVSHSVWPVPQTRVLRQCCRLPLNVFCILISLFGGCLCASSVETGDRKHTANLLHQLSVQQQQHEHLQQRAALELSLLRRHKVHRATRTTK